MSREGRGGCGARASERWLARDTEEAGNATPLYYSSAGEQAASLSLSLDESEECVLVYARVCIYTRK